MGPRAVDAACTGDVDAIESAESKVCSVVSQHNARVVDLSLTTAIAVVAYRIRIGRRNGEKSERAKF